MAFEVRYAPKTEFDISGAYFDALERARAQRAAEEASAIRMQIAQQASDDRRYAVDSANARASDRLAFDREQDSFERSASEAARMQEEDEARSIADTYYAAMNEGRPAPEGFIDTPYGVRVPVVQPKSRAGTRLLLDAVGKALDSSAKRKAEEERKASAAAVGGALGIDPSIPLESPDQAISMARVQSTMKRLEELSAQAKQGVPMSPEILTKARESFRLIMPFLSPEQADALAWLRENKYPVPLPSGVQEPWRDPTYQRMAKDRERLADQIAALERAKGDTASERRSNEEKLTAMRARLQQTDAALQKIESSWASMPAGGADQGGDRDELIRMLEEED